MLILTVTLPFVAIVTMLLFYKLKWATTNYLGNLVPYSLGCFVLYSFLLFGFFAPFHTAVFSGISMLYLVGIWFIGLIDDRFGDRKTKGLKGHISAFLYKRTVSTGMLKIFGTVVLTYFLLFFLDLKSMEQWFRFAILLLLTPHVMNLFDTRPLRVWKVSLLHCALFLPLLDFMPFSYYLYIVTFFFIFYVLEGHAVAMLGDNGATLIGGILALLTIFHAPVQQQYEVISLLVLLTIFAERVSFSQWIEKHPILRFVDSWGISSK